MAEDVLINFIGKIDELRPAVDVLEFIDEKGDNIGETWKKTAAIMANGNKAAVEGTNKLAKSIEQMAVAAKSMDKVVIGGAYKKYLKEIQTQLGLTNKELISYVQNARKSAQEAVFSAQTQQEADELRISIEVMNEQLVMLAANEEKVETKSVSLRARLREAKEELVAMAEAGQAGTPAFEELKQKAGELDDQMRDLNATVKNVGSDTKNIDGLISLMSGVAGGFAVAQGAAALFGSENEEVQQALLKVNAAMSILQGLQALQNVLQKESAASLLLQTGATQGATVATKGLSAAMAANPVGALLVGITALITAISIFSSESEDANEIIQKTNESLLEQINSIQDLKELLYNVYDDRILRAQIDLNTAQADGSSKSKVLALQYKLLGEQFLKTQKDFQDTGGDTALEKFRVQAEDAKIALIQLQKQKIEFAKAGQELSDDDESALKARESEYKLFKTQYDNQKKIVDDFHSTVRDFHLQEVEMQRYQYEQAVKSAESAAEAEVAIKKKALFEKDVDSLSSIKAITQAEINAINERVDAEKKLNANLTPGERKKLEAEAALQIRELRQKLNLDILEIEKAGINARLILTKKGTEEEYNERINLIEKERAIELSATQLTEEQVAEIKAKYRKQALEALREFQEAQLQNQISILNADLDQFGITENDKLQLVLERLEVQRQLEISQAEENGAKIAEINARYDKQIIEARKAAIETTLQKTLDIQRVYGAIARQENDRILNSEKSTFNERLKAIAANRASELDSINARKIALRDELLQKVITLEEYKLKYQELLNEEAALTKETQEKTTGVIIAEIQKRTAALQATFSILLKSIQDTLGPGAFSTGAQELVNFGITAQNVFEKIKAGVITTEEGIKQIATAGLSAIQSITNQIFADNAAARQQELQDTIATLEEQKQRELDNKNLTKQQEADIEAKFKARERQEKIKAFEADKDAKRQQAVINGFLAVSQAFASNPFPYSVIVAGIVAAATAIQVSKISNTRPPKFKEGKVDIEGPGTTTSDSIHAMISRGESVISADATSKWKDALMAINENKFEDYLLNKLKDFVFPSVPEWAQTNSNNYERIDYDLLADKMAMKMKGIIPAPAQVYNNIDEDGFHSFVVQGNDKTTYKNKRYKID